jgi:hypothetical protein
MVLPTHVGSERKRSANQKEDEEPKQNELQTVEEIKNTYQHIFNMLGKRTARETVGHISRWELGM